MPLGPRFGVNSTRWPSLSVRKPVPWISLKCAKRSSPPPSGVMNPKPLVSLNHLTVPVAVFDIYDFPFKTLRYGHNRPRGARDQERWPGVLHSTALGKRVSKPRLNTA